MTETLFSEKSDSSANTQVKSHFVARRCKLEDPFASLLPVSEWPQEPHEIDFFKKSWSNIALKHRKL